MDLVATTCDSWVPGQVQPVGKTLHTGEHPYVPTSKIDPKEKENHCGLSPGPIDPKEKENKCGLSSGPKVAQKQSKA